MQKEVKSSRIFVALIAEIPYQTSAIKEIVVFKQVLDRCLGILKTDVRKEFTRRKESWSTVINNCILSTASYTLTCCMLGLELTRVHR
jgi:hypothetical protein